MTLNLGLMILSGLIMSFMFVHKHLEINKGITFASLEKRYHIDSFFRKIQTIFNHYMSMITWHNTSLFLHNFSVYFAKFLMRLSYLGHKISARLVEKASKRKENLSKSGVASFYIKQVRGIKDEKKDVGEI